MSGVEKTLLKNIARLNFIGRCGIVYVIYILYKYINININIYRYINIDYIDYGRRLFLLYFKSVL